MSSKRKWDQAAPDADSGNATPTKAVKAEDGKTASEAAAAAAAIAAKIAAQYAGGGGEGTSGGNVPGATKDPHDGDFTYDIDINDVRNRYMLTKGETQRELYEETGASLSTKGTWYPDRSKATEKDPPLYLHISATTNEILQKAVQKVNDLLSQDLGPLVDDRRGRDRERRKWPEEKVAVGLESIRNFNVRAKVVGPQGLFVKYIQQETGTRVQIKGFGSGFVETETGREAEEPMFIHVTGPDEGQVMRGKALAEDLLEVVKGEHDKVVNALQHQQMELHQAQVHANAPRSAPLGGYAPPPPSSAPPPPPPGGDAPPPPPPDGSAPPPPPGGASQPSQGAGSQEAYLQYWAAYGYDVNSPQFREWLATQQQQSGQYYGQAGGPSGTPNGAPAPPSDAAPPPPPPPA